MGDSVKHQYCPPKTARVSSLDTDSRDMWLRQRKNTDNYLLAICSALQANGPRKAYVEAYDILIYMNSPSKASRFHSADAHHAQVSACKALAQHRTPQSQVSDSRSDPVGFRIRVSLRGCSASAMQGNTPRFTRGQHDLTASCAMGLSWDQRYGDDACCSHPYALRAW